MAIRFHPTLLPLGFLASALNDTGLVVGGRDRRAVVFRRGRFEKLSGKTQTGLGHSRDSALAVSSNGVVAGSVGWLLTGAITEWPSEAVLWQGAKRDDAPAVPGYSGASFLGVNARGEAVGEAGRTLFPETRGLIDAPIDDPSIDRSGGVITYKNKALHWDGKTLHAEGWGTLHAINDAGATVGALDSEAVFRPGAGTAWTKICRGEAVGISPGGLVCGNRNVGDSKLMQSETKGGGMETIRFYFPLFRGFVWRSGKLADLPPLPGCDESRALGVNDGGWAVGSCRRTENYGQSRATLWQGGKPLALDTLVFLRGWKLAEALAINSHEQILCTARDTKGNSRSVLLTPTRK